MSVTEKTIYDGPWPKKLRYEAWQVRIRRQPDYCPSELAETTHYSPSIFLRGLAQQSM
jgi:hypothetical protein